MSDLWGFAGGMQEAQHDNQQAQLFQAQMQEVPIKLASERMSLEEQGVALETAQINLQSLKKFNQMAQSYKPGQEGGQGSPGDKITSAVEQHASELDDFGNMSLLAGRPEQAKEYFTTASSLRRNAAEVSSREQVQGMKNLDLIGRLLPTVHDQTSWSQANAMFAMETGKPSPFANTPYSPELKEKLENSYASVKDSLAAKASAARTTASEAETKERTARLALIESQTKLADARADHLGKEGVDVKPKAEDLKAASDLVLHDYPDLANQSGEASSEARMYARPIADRMVELQRQGMTRSNAAIAAYKEFESQGHFEGLTKGTKDSGTRYLPIPYSKDTKLVPNKYYVNPQGQVALWTGTAFQTPKQEVEERELGDDDDEANDEQTDQ